MSEQADETTETEAAEPSFIELARGCKRWLAGSPPLTPREELTSLIAELDLLDVPDEWDRYAEHGPVAQLEREVADLLGKPAAAMFPSGTMAQQSVLRVWADRAGSRRVAIPGQSHLLHHELDGPQLLHGFRWERLSDSLDLPTLERLTEVPGPLGAVLLELPLRDAGYQLPTWEQLEALSAGCRERGVPLHLDGARLWESQPFLGRDLAEIAGLADSVYVSCYKGLRAMTGAVLVGSEDVVAEARQWRKRMGGTLFGMLPYAVGALRGLRTELPTMGDRHARALELARAFTERGVRVFPDPPHTDAFRISVPVPAATVIERVRAVMRAEGVAVSPPWSDSEIPGWSWTEFTVGPATLEWPVDEAADLLARVVLDDPEHPERGA